MKLNVEKLKSNQIPIGKNGLVVDNTRVPIKEKVKPIPLNQEQQQNFKLYGSLNKPEVKQTYLSQGKRLTPAEQQASNKKLAEQGKLQAYQKQQEQDAKNLEKAVAVAPYVIPGIGQAMWAGKAVDLAVNGASDGKYNSWGNAASQITGGPEWVGDLTNPGYIIGGASQILKKPIQRLTNVPKIKIELGRTKIIPELGHVKNFNVYLNGKQILNQDLQNSLNIVDKGNEIVVGNIFLPEELRGKGLTKKIYQELANFNKKPLVNSSKYGFNQSEAGARIWKNKESFIPNTSFKTYLLNKAGPYLMGDKKIPKFGSVAPAAGLYGLTQSKKQGGGLLERKGAPFVTPKPIQPEFPYNGQSMYKGGYNLKRALELYKPDKTGHLPSVDSETGEWLKDRDYPTAWKELMQTTLNLNLNKQVGFPILNTNGRLQYINKNNK